MTTATEKPGCLAALLRWLGLVPTQRPTQADSHSVQHPVEEAPTQEVPPFHLRDDFLSRAELSFYHVMQSAVADWAVVCPKVSLAELFFAKTGDYGTNRSWMNRIDRKRMDFLLCDPKTMRPLLGVELDDASHQRHDREERDEFVDQVFAAAELPLAHVSVQGGYDTRELEAYLRREAGILQTSDAAAPSQDPEPGETVPTQPSSPSPSASSPLCPKCGTPMVLRVVRKEGPYKGKRFWGCLHFPKCRGVRDIG